MKLFRKIIFWCHLVTGVSIAVVVFVMAVTGVLLTYERQVVAWADTHGLDAGPVDASAQRLSIDELLVRMTDAASGAPSTITLHHSADAPVAAAFGREGTAYYSAYTGEKLGETDSGVRSFFRSVEDWHRWLGAGGDNRKLARAATGASNLAFLFIVVSGIYLWWPRNWGRKALRHVTFLQRGLSPKARDFNWHNVIGLWSFLPLFFIVLSGVVISYRWAGELVYVIAGDTPPGGRAEGPRDGPVTMSALPPTPASLSLAQLEKVAADRVPGWNTIAIRIPAETDSTARFTIDAGTGGQPHKRSTLTLDRFTGKEVTFESFADASPGRRARSVLRFAHTGEVLGLFGQTIAGLVSLGTAFLVYTGLSLSLRRLRSWLKRRR